MAVGTRIRTLRNASGMTQRDLAQKVGLTEAAVRNYELGLRTPKPAKLAQMAEALGVSPDALREVEVSDARGALELLFRAERQLGLKPVVEDGRILVEVDKSVPGAQKTVMAMKAWQRMADQLAAGEITEDEYELWKARFTY